MKIETSSILRHFTSSFPVLLRRVPEIKGNKYSGISTSHREIDLNRKSELKQKLKLKINRQLNLLSSPYNLYNPSSSSSYTLKDRYISTLIPTRNRNSEINKPIINYFLFSQGRFKSKKKRKEKVIITPEKLANKGLRHTTMTDRICNPESPYIIAKTIRKYMARLTTAERHHIRRKKDHSIFNYHRVLKIAGLTHDNDNLSSGWECGNEETETETGDQNAIKKEGRRTTGRRMKFTTGLTALQDNASLPPTPHHYRNKFPHMVIYRAMWGGPTTDKDPHRYGFNTDINDVTVSCVVRDIGLLPLNEERLIEIVGNTRYDNESGVLTLEGNIFKNRNHNAAFLGDSLEHLVKQCSHLPDAPPS